MHRRRSIFTFATLITATATAPSLARATEQTIDEATALSTSADGGGVTYDKGLQLTTPGGWVQAKPGGRLQLRSTTETRDGTADSEANIKRARLFLKGHAVSKALQYKFQADFAERQFDLKDLYLDVSLAQSFVLRVGRFKRPYSRQQLNSSGNTEFADRAITDKGFAPGRDWGVSLHNFGEKSPELEYSLGIFNGHGTDGYFNRDESADGGLSPAAVGRIGINRGGIKGYSEADLEGGGLRYGAGVSVNADLEDSGTGWRGELDGIVKFDGLSASGAVYGRTSADEERAAGMHVQVGYVVAETVQPVIRYALIRRDGANDDTQEALGGISLYLWKHRLKLQTEAGVLREQRPGDDATTWVARSQMQIIL